MRESIFTIFFFFFFKKYFPQSKGDLENVFFDDRYRSKTKLKKWPLDRLVKQRIKTNICRGEAPPHKSLFS